jgi:uncharacterized membrane protein YhaH (DUF805 family)
MFGAIKYGLVNLANFKGRDERQTFWCYVLFLVILRFIAGLAISLPTTAHAMSVAMQAAQSQADPATMQAQMFAAMAESLPMAMWLGVVVGVVTAILLVASLVRRLHDSGLSGWWALLPAALQAFALAQAPAALHRAMDMLTHLDARTMPNPAAMMQAQGVTALIGWLPAIIVVIAGVRKSNDGPNRFGEAAVRF